MLLTVLERLMLVSLLPRVGDITTLLLVKQLQEEAGFTEDEHAALNFVQGEKGNISWTDAVPPKEVRVGKKTRQLIQNELGALSAAGQLTFDHLGLWDKFNAAEPRAPKQPKAPPAD